MSGPHANPIHTRLLGAILVLVVAAACQNDRPAPHEVLAIDPQFGGDGYHCAIWSAGPDGVFDTGPQPNDDYQSPAHLTLRVRNQAYDRSMADPERSAGGDVRIAGVSVEWVEVDPPRPGLLDAMQRYDTRMESDLPVPAGAEVVFNVLMLPLRAKREWPLRDLAPVHGGDGTVAPFRAVAEIHFHVEQEGDGQAFELVRRVPVRFVGLDSGSV